MRVRGGGAWRDMATHGHWASREEATKAQVPGRSRGSPEKKPTARTPPLFWPRVERADAERLRCRHHRTAAERAATHAAAAAAHRHANKRAVASAARAGSREMRVAPTAKAAAAAPPPGDARRPAQRRATIASFCKRKSPVSRRSTTPRAITQTSAGQGALAKACHAAPLTARQPASRSSVRMASETCKERARRIGHQVAHRGSVKAGHAGTGTRRGRALQPSARSPAARRRVLGHVGPDAPQSVVPRLLRGRRHGPHHCVQTALLLGPAEAPSLRDTPRITDRPQMIGFAESNRENTRRGAGSERGSAWGRHLHPRARSAP